MTIKKTTLDRIIYFFIVISAVLFLFVGNRIASLHMHPFFDEDIHVVSARVTEVTYREHRDFFGFIGMFVEFEAIITEGAHRDRTITAQQFIDDYHPVAIREVAAGDRVVLSSFADDGDWWFQDFVRINQVIIIGAVFVVLLIIFGRVKGLNTLIALGLTCTAVFAVLIPALLSGRNIYHTAIIVCVYSILTTLFIVNRVNRKSVAAVIGCFGGVVVIGLLTFVMERTLELSGVISEDSLDLLFLPARNPIDLRAIVFAGIIIGASGAIMDIAMSIASSLWEMRVRAPGIGFKELFSSGINIGRDMMGTMVNTLVMAYIGSSLSIVLLLFVYTNSLTDLLNRESVIAELLQAIIGSIGILATMPFTAFICAVFYRRKA